MSAIPKISSLLNMGKENLEKESLKTYLHIKLRHCESEIFNIAKKYGILSIEEFEDRYKKGEIEEEGTWEDFFKLDHLEAEKETIKCGSVNVKTFPKHFHNGSEGNVCESLISDDPANAIREFLVFARKIVDKGTV
ncbi:MAG TPA: hypothetical protein C5S37_10140 [Methanophagales archaeon]|nr:hypothetical protein [Methanophagales archaeon]